MERPWVDIRKRADRTTSLAHPQVIGGVGGGGVWVESMNDRKMCYADLQSSGSEELSCLSVRAPLPSGRLSRT